MTPAQESLAAMEQRLTRMEAQVASWQEIVDAAVASVDKPRSRAARRKLVKAVEDARTLALDPERPIR